MTALEIRLHRSCLLAHAWAASYYSEIRRSDMVTQHVLSTCALLATGGGAWGQRRESRHVKILQAEASIRSPIPLAR